MTDNNSEQQSETTNEQLSGAGQKGGEAPPVTIDDCVTARAQILVVQNDVQGFMEDQRDKIGSALQRWESISLEDLDGELLEQVKTTRSELRAAYRQLGGQQ